MAQHFLSDVDFHKRQLLRAVPEKASVAPSNPVEGQVYYDTVSKTSKQYNGTIWKDMGAEYILPTASASTLGGIKVGSGLEIDQNGILSAIEGSGGGAQLVNIHYTDIPTLTYSYIKTNFFDNDIIPILVLWNEEGYPPQIECPEYHRILYFIDDVELDIDNTGTATRGYIFGSVSPELIHYDTNNTWVPSGDTATFMLFITASGARALNDREVALQNKLEFITEPSHNNPVATKTEIDDLQSLIDALGNVLTFKGVKSTYAEIQAITDAKVGDVWLCSADNSEYVCISSDGFGHIIWEKFGVIIDLSGYLQIADLVDDIANNASETEKAPSVKGVVDFAEAKANKITNLNAGLITNDQYPTAIAVNNKLALGKVNVPGAQSLSTTCTPEGSISVTGAASGETGDIAVINTASSPVAAAVITANAQQNVAFTTMSAAMSTEVGEEETLVFSATPYGFSAENVYNSNAVVQKNIEFAGASTTIDIPNTVAAAGEVSVTFVSE